ncbi:MAG: fatty acid cis/trans isomerase [Gammaproteobacteria bacterium]|nr:fatty acid cis/trans isomerase [Gammaproteobacteria bacterium]
MKIHLLLPVKKNILIFLFIALITGCTSSELIRLNQEYGTARATNLNSPHKSEQSISFQQQIKPILDSRCVVCHGCYDAPCQLKLSAYEGITRGASKEKVYDGTRLLASQLTRLFEDAETPAEWRNMDFYPVINERVQNYEANLNAGVMARILKQKRIHPLPKTDILPDSFDFSLNRNQQCATIENFKQYETDYPLWGMPYGLPELSNDEYRTLISWLEQGSPNDTSYEIRPDMQDNIDTWERFLNGNTLKQQLMSRYIYEHLFIANLYFEDLNQRKFFKLIRSRTPPGKPVDIIATRRPYDNPGTGRVYYRLQAARTSILSKTHMPYALSKKRMQRYQELFLDEDYAVLHLPPYTPKISSNPFESFKDIPVKSRYKFMLDEAQFTIMGFIKGPVCRGQVALNVIQDHFWVAFLDPDNFSHADYGRFLAENSDNLRLPAAEESNALPLTTWITYSGLQKKYLAAKDKYINNKLTNPADITLNRVWNGNTTNSNSALTIFRHFDSASVVKGFIGKDPKTAWIIGYPLLERIHYLLVAGFDVYGNVGHQLNTRLYMDFLRMEGENSFLSFLPARQRIIERDLWYRGASKELKEYVLGEHIQLNTETGIKFKSSNPKPELYTMLKQHMGSALSTKHNIENISNTDQQLAKLDHLEGSFVSLLPQTIFLTITDPDNNSQQTYTLINNSAHLSVSHIFFEEDERVPEEDYLTIAKGFIGNYPNVFLRLNKYAINEFVYDLGAIQTAGQYKEFLDRYAIRRSDPQFWQHSDQIHQEYQHTDPIEASLFDYNRLENR